VHCQNFRCIARHFRGKTLNTGANYSKRKPNAPKSYSIGIEHNKKNKRIRILHTRVKLGY